MKNKKELSIYKEGGECIHIVDMLSDDVRKKSNYYINKSVCSVMVNSLFYNIEQRLKVGNEIILNESIKLIQDNDEGLFHLEIGEYENIESHLVNDLSFQNACINYLYKRYKMRFDGIESYKDIMKLMIEKIIDFHNLGNTNKNNMYIYGYDLLVNNANTNRLSIFTEDDFLLSRNILITDEIGIDYREEKRLKEKIIHFDKIYITKYKDFDKLTFTKSKRKDAKEYTVNCYDIINFYKDGVVIPGI